MTPEIPQLGQGPLSSLCLFSISKDTEDTPNLLTAAASVALESVLCRVAAEPQATSQDQGT